VTGGCSAIGGTVALRGVPEDYDEWAALGNPAWAWPEVLPFFRRVEDDRDADPGDPLHGRGGPIPIRRWRTDELIPTQRAFLDACLAAGLAEVADHNDPTSSGVGPTPTNGIGGERVSAARGYLDPARDRPNLEIRSGVLVDRVLLDDGRVVGVRIGSGDQAEQVAARRVTVSAGALLSPAVLQRSGVGPKEDLAGAGVETLVESPGVGANLVDHPCSGVLVVPRPGVCDPAKPFSQVLVRTTSAGPAERNDVQYYMVSYYDLRPFPQLMAMAGAPTIIGAMVVGQRPRSRGRVAITSADPAAPPDVRLGLLTAEQDVDQLVHGIRQCWQLLAAPGIQRHTERTILLREEMLGSREALRHYLEGGVFTAYHPVGTARMGPDGDRHAVVDQHCRVRGVEGLQVADASVMPTIVRANTNLTCLMIGERVAAWIREQ
jgi:choline dehydrogenase